MWLFRGRFWCYLHRKQHIFYLSNWIGWEQWRNYWRNRGKKKQMLKPWRGWPKSSLNPWRGRLKYSINHVLRLNQVIVIVAKNGCSHELLQNQAYTNSRVVTTRIWSSTPFWESKRLYTNKLDAHSCKNTGEAAKLALLQSAAAPTTFPSTVNHGWTMKTVEAVPKFGLALKRVEVCMCGNCKK